jgi:hypothetical protein
MPDPDNLNYLQHKASMSLKQIPIQAAQANGFSCATGSLIFQGPMNLTGNLFSNL